MTEEISKTPEVFYLLKRNQLLIPMSFFKDVQKEEGIIIMDFSNKAVFRTLKNVSETLSQKFLHEYHRDLI